MPHILACAVAPAPQRLSQGAARQFAQAHFAGGLADVERLLGVFDNAGVESRDLCRPTDWYREPRSFAEKNREFIEWSERLGARAAELCLERAGVRARDVTHLIFVSTTGFATPSIDARLIPRIGLSAHTRRTPIVGLGCAGGAAGLAHAERSARAAPDELVLLVAVETTSLTFMHEDHSKSNLVATALFGDGAAAVLVAGDGAGDHAGRHAPRILASGSTLFPDSLDVMGWNFLDHGLQVVFSRAIPSIVRRNGRANVQQFLRQHRLHIADIDCWVVHPGGQRVIDAYEAALGLSAEALHETRAVLRDHGNMSSATVLYVLDRFLRGSRPRSGERALVTALGPGFSSEHVLLEG